MVRGCLCSCCSARGVTSWLTASSGPQGGVSCTTVPLEIPSSNKRAVKPSPSRCDHGATPYAAAFGPGAAPTLANYQTGVASYGLDAWAVNTFMRGSREEGLAQVQAFVGEHSWVVDD